MQIVNKKRVRDHAEVYTNKREVQGILDLVSIGNINHDDRCLEPACGVGIFLEEILERKLQRVKEISGSSHHEIICNSLIAIFTTYGVDILQENVDNCVNNLYKKIMGNKLLKQFKGKEELGRVVKKILTSNIICCDFTSGTKNDGEDAQVTQWSLNIGTMQCSRSIHSFYEVFVRGSNHKEQYGTLGLSFNEMEPVSIWEIWKE